VADACRDVQRVIDGARSPLIAEGHVGRRMAPARGISICFPSVPDPSATYQELDFALATRWSDLLAVRQRAI
jgi:hypothetical protein